MPRRKLKGSGDVLGRSAEMIGWALGGLEREIAQTRERLATLTEQAAKLRARVGRSAARSPAAAASFDEPGVTGRKAGRRRRMSAEARRAISERMTRRWAEWRRKNRPA